MKPSSASQTLRMTGGQFYGLLISYWNSIAYMNMGFNVSSITLVCTFSHGMFHAVMNGSDEPSSSAAGISLHWNM